MAANIQAQVLALHACASRDDPKLNAEKAENIVIDLQHLILEDLEKEHDLLDYCTSILFDKENGLVPFLRTTIPMDEFENSKTECLKLMQPFLQRIGKKALDYAVDIKTVVFSAFIRDKKAKVKVAAYPILTQVLTISAGSQVTSQDLQVKAMVEKLFEELATKATKLAGGVKRCIYALLGKCAEVYPERLVGGYSTKLIDVYVRALKAEMTSKTKDIKMDVITGCFEGLTYFLVNFTHSAEEGSKYSYDIFKYARMAISNTNDMHRYHVPKSALDLLAKHGDQFSEYMVDDYENMYHRLCYWSKHHNRDMIHAGLPALEAFLRQISEMLVMRASEGKREGAVFKFFIQQFRSVMDNPEASSKEVSLAIKGYGYFAAPCRIFLTGEDVKYMFNDMMARSEQIFFSQEENILDDRLISLPSFLEALASIVKELDGVSESFVVSLEKLVVMLIHHFPKLSPKLHFLCFRAIVKVFLALAPKGTVFNSFISHVVYQGLIRCCSHPVAIATDDQMYENQPTSVDEKKPRITYKDYLELWEVLLDNYKIKELGSLGVDIEERKALTRVLYDELIGAVLKILRKLDLTSNKSTDLDEEIDLGAGEPSRSSSPTTVTSDPVQGLHAAKPRDFQILVNLVDFCRDLLPKKYTDHFKRWVFTFGHEVILQSTNHPLVSGFYKLLAVCMKICVRTSYFKEVFGMEVKAEENSMEVDVDLEEGDLAERQAAFSLFTKFTKEVLERMKQYKDDLLAGCLSLILSLPQEVIESQMNNIVPAVQLTFHIGLSYLPLAMAGLDALEHWIATLPQHIMQPYYKDILPCLDGYLRTSADIGTDKPAENAIILTSNKSKSSGKGQRKVPVKVLKSNSKDKQSQVKQQETQLKQVKLRCVKLLGSLGGSNNSCLVSSTADDIAKAAMAWDKTKHLKFDVPFMDIKPVIYFDSFLPRIVELATTSSDRQTKVAACELLHSMVLYMLGRGAIQPGETQHKYPMDALYRRVFPAILLLACDVEQVSRQLFEPLMMQLIHWFTNNRKFESEETAALLDTLMDGVESASNSAMRDLSAQCLKEFLIWSIKQSSKKKKVPTATLR